MPLETGHDGIERFVDPETGEDVPISRLFMVAVTSGDPAVATRGCAVVAEDGVPWHISDSNLSLVSPDTLLNEIRPEGEGGKGLQLGTEWSEKRKLAAIRAYTAETGREPPDLGRVMAGSPV